MQFRVLNHDSWVPDTGCDTAYLKIDRWNDFSFVTMFSLSFHDSEGVLHKIGDVKIGFKGQTEDIPTYKKLPNTFEDLDESYFSLGDGLEFYKKMRDIPDSKAMLLALRDIVQNPAIIETISAESVFSTSLLRSQSLSIVKGQYSRVLKGGVELTDFNFKFVRPATDTFGGLDLNFNVDAESSPSTNIHAIIGRNGAGKTTLLNGMIQSITNKTNSQGKFYETAWYGDQDIDTDYFSSLVSVSFSAFDPFPPPPEQSDPAKGTCYFYIGLKDQKNINYHKTIDELHLDCASALLKCFQEGEKSKRWLSAIEKLGSDDNFSSMRLERLHSFFLERLQDDYNSFAYVDAKQKYYSLVKPILSEMSSGHAIVLLTITELVSKVEEKTLVLLDEPESHLHPPLLSAFIRALGDLLHDRNGVAIIATHSPVVLQEIPKSCVWKIFRKGENVQNERPKIETFAENVGVLTSEVFSLEVERSGFHSLLAASVASGKNYHEILSDYNNNLGFEGRAILKAMIADRERGETNDEN